MTDSGKPETTALAPASGKKSARVSRGRLLRIVAVGLVAGACIGTVAGVSGMVERADKKVATQRWGELAEPGKDPAERAY
ncbi:hypothetical protein ABZ694_07170 [Streptomyces albidoflavus]|uniref:hypothetical protein n=2 Tax=Streptomyces TaxID=1883 RepID=UPI0033C20035